MGNERLGTLGFIRRRILGGEINMKTLAQLKRDLVVGARVKTIVQTIKPE
jgi:hypothetical protein